MCYYLLRSMLTNHLGCVKLAFELVKPEPPEGPTLVLRILDILTPIKYAEGNYKTIKAGQLLQKITKNSFQTWAYSLADRSNGAAWLRFIKKTSRGNAWEHGGI